MSTSQNLAVVLDNLGPSVSGTHRSSQGRGGQAQMLNPPDRGIRGNSHMIVQDKNNLQIADLIIGWIGEAANKR